MTFWRSIGNELRRRVLVALKYLPVDAAPGPGDLGFEGTEQEQSRWPGPARATTEKRRLRPNSALARHEAERTIDCAQHAVKFMSAPDDQPGRGNHAVDPLPQSQRRIFFNTVDRNFGRSTKYRKHRSVLQEVDGIVSPLALGDLASVKTEYAPEFAPIEGDLSGRLSSGKRCTARTLAHPLPTLPRPPP
jgi:hypothetical protein